MICSLCITDPVQAAPERQAVALASDPHGGLHAARRGHWGRDKHHLHGPADRLQHPAARGRGGVHTYPGE